MPQTTANFDDLYKRIFPPNKIWQGEINEVINQWNNGFLSNEEFANKIIELKQKYGHTTSEN